MPTTPDEFEIGGPVLHKLVWGGLPPEDFVARYEEEVGTLSDEIVERSANVKLPRYGHALVEIFRGGLVIVTGENSKQSLFETQARVEEREHIRRWAEFSRGYWTKKVPTSDGFWPVRARDGKMSIHCFKYQDGRLVDTDCGYVPAGKTTNWECEFWSLPLGSLPGSW